MLCYNSLLSLTFAEPNKQKICLKIVSVFVRNIICNEENIEQNSEVWQFCFEAFSILANNNANNYSNSKPI